MSEEGALVASSRDRQRKLARAKLDRQMARRAATARRKRQVRAGIGTGLAVLLVVLGSVWLFGGFSGEPDDTAAQEQCAWTPQNTTANANLKDVGTPATKDLPTKGTRVMTLVTDGGDVTVELDVTSSPCGTASLAYLAEKKFYTDTKCHELTGTFLRCGDPSGTGQGGPTYSFFGENVPSAPEASASPSPGASPSAAPGGEPQYPRGTVALVAGTPGNFGSQFVIFHKELATTEPSYSIVGRVIGGLPVLDKIVKTGTVDDGTGAKVKPAKDVVIKSLNVREADERPVATPPATTSPGAASPGTASPGTSPSPQS
jgi:peptidyl-prolyl cis-trans isomerase B (cyclophilin B)